LSEMQEKVPGVAPAAPPAPSTSAPAEAPPAPAPEAVTPPPVTPEASANPEPATPPEAPEATASQPPPIPVHSDTTKILVIVALAGGAVVGVALGLGGGKSSTVSPE
jgi:hypothetical protein